LKSFLELLVLATIVLKKGIKIILISCGIQKEVKTNIITKEVNDTIPIVIEIKKELENSKCNMNCLKFHQIGSRRTSNKNSGNFSGVPK
jgi:hypothetical protein